jgi:hypothetical protein
MLPNQSVRVQVAEAFIPRGRALEVGEEERRLPDTEPFLFVDAFRTEQVTEGSVSPATSRRRRRGRI